MVIVAYLKKGKKEKTLTSGGGVALSRACSLVNLLSSPVISVVLFFLFFGGILDLTSPLEYDDL